MASGFFALFDDIALLMDDVAVMSKLAAKKTAGVLGDDLAVNANKASGFPPSRELPVLWAISKGSLVNKFIILPIAFLLSAFAPALITPILMFGGVYLAYEGAEKIVEYLFHSNKNIATNGVDSSDVTEAKKIRSAIVTDFILSIEIVIIALGSVAKEPLLVQILVVTFVSILATVGVYGFVALIVRMDDIGYKLIQLSNNQGFLAIFGRVLIATLPKVIRLLSVIGTIAMLLVAGGIFMHHFKWIEQSLHILPMLLGEFVLGLIVGLIVVTPIEIFNRLKKRGL